MTQEQSGRVLRWMKRRLVTDTPDFVDARTGEVNMTTLGEYTAEKWPEAVFDLDDDTDEVWELAFEVSEWWDEIHRREE